MHPLSRVAGGPATTHSLPFVCFCAAAVVAAAGVVDRVTDDARYRAEARVTAGAGHEPAVIAESLAQRAARRVAAARGLDAAAAVHVSAVPRTQIVNIAVTAGDPQGAADTANAVAAAFLEESDRATHQTLDAALAEVSRQIGLQREVIAARRRDVARVSNPAEPLLSAGAISDALGRARQQRLAAEAVVRQLDAASTPANVNAILYEPSVQQARLRLASLEQTRAAILGRYGERHPEVQRFDREIARARDEVDTAVGAAASALRRVYDTALTEERLLTAEAQRVAAQQRGQGRIAADAYTLARQLDTDRRVYDDLLARERELTAARTAAASGAAMVDAAVPPAPPLHTPSYPYWPIAGILLVAGALMTDRGRRRVRRFVRPPAGSLMRTHSWPPSVETPASTGARERRHRDRRHAA